MKGDFSRSTFDPDKHYTSVRMQQGRVQLDADWNEQADILLHLITTQLQDLLGPAGTTVTKPGFAITLDRSEEKPADQGQVDQPEEPTAPAPGVAITPDRSEEEPADQGQARQPEEPTAPAPGVTITPDRSEEKPAEQGQVGQPEELTASGGGVAITPDRSEEKPADQGQVDQPEEPTASAPEVAISPDRSEEKPADQGQVGQPEEPTVPTTTLSDFWIGAGRYYVDGILCENKENVLFSKQPDYPAAASELKKAVGHDHVLVYLDVWQRHITAIEDPAIREIALGGPDTTTRIKTVWQVKLLPLPRDLADQDWRAFVARTTDKGRLKAQWDKDKGAFLENHLYRVEIHSVALDLVTLKWSPENGSVAVPIGEEYLFTWEDVPGKDEEHLLQYLREGLALDWAKGNRIGISKSKDGNTIRIKTGGNWAEIVLNTEEKAATLIASTVAFKWSRENGSVVFPVTAIQHETFKWPRGTGSALPAPPVDAPPAQEENRSTLSVTVEGLERDPDQLQVGSWVELVDDVTVLNGCPLPLCQVKELDRQKGEVKLSTEKNKMDLFLAASARGLRHPLLRRWERDAKPMYLFIWEDVPGKDEEHLLKYLREDLALDWAKGNRIGISKSKDGKTIRIENGEDWVEIVLDEEEKTATLTTRDGKRHILKVWQEKDKLKKVYPETWLLENGIQVSFVFGDTGSYQVGDYWLIPARTNSKNSIEWPQKDGQPLAQAPHGIVHHYAPLALLQFGEKEGWSVLPKEPTAFRSLPQIDADLIRVDKEQKKHKDTLARHDKRVADLEERLAVVDDRLDKDEDNLGRLGKRISVLEERQADFQAPLVQYFQIENGIHVGHVVSVIPADPSDEPESELRVRLAISESERDRRLVVGVVKEILEDRESCRVVLYGRAQCKVIGEIKPGDVLVPSDRPGYAQKAGRFLRPATILGKALGSNRLDAEAMEEIDEGKPPDQLAKSKWTGTVDMMVMLG